MEDEDDIEFLNFEASEILENEDGSVDIEFSNEPEIIENYSVDHFENIAERIDTADLDEIGSNVVDAYENDRSSRDEWEQMTLDHIDALGLIVEDGTEPFDGACTATHPLILESTVKFQSKTSNELLPSKGPVKTRIIGHVTEELEKRAKRIRNDMNYLVQHEISEFYSESEKTFFFTGLLGNCFKKSYFDPVKNRICNEMVIDKIYVNHLAKSIETAERISHVFYISKRRMLELIDSDYFLDWTDEEAFIPSTPETSVFEDKIREIQGIAPESQMYDDVYTVVEQHCYLQLNEDTMEIDEDQVPRPYVVICDINTGKVLSIRRNWSENDDSMCRLEWFTHYQFVPTAGFYALGYVHLLGNIQRTLTLAMRSLADAGQFANLQAGFKSSSARIVGNHDDPIGPGEFREVEIPAVAKISDVFFPLPFKEPSVVLFQLMQELTAVGQKFADSTEQVIADSTNYGPVGTTMALLEASTRFYASVYKRQYLAQSNEFKIIARLINDYGDENYPYLVDPDQAYNRRIDYDQNVIAIIPVSDPNYSSQAQRVSKAQVILDTALKTPHVHDLREVVREFYKSFEIDDVDKLVPPESKPEKREPIDDILAIVQGKPVAAFKGQDHQAHIMVKSAWMQDPANGGSETMKMFHPVILANIREHQFMKFAEEVGAVMASEQLSQSEAATRISRLNQIAQEEEQQGSPAYVIAKAELMKAETGRQKEGREAQQDQFKLGIDLLQTAANIEREKNRAEEMGRKIDLDTVKMGVDLLKAGVEEAKAGGNVTKQKS